MNKPLVYGERKAVSAGAQLTLLNYTIFEVGVASTRLAFHHARVKAPIGIGGSHRRDVTRPG
jgi:hypothetical protein